ncbi:MAG: hypothetical protein J5J00_16995 [Deltaproteobacteria bacterium]|nr:hypothetical protein [Deltaproteobacteria bacterium]
MIASDEVLRALLSERIDHSALFPPTALELDAALRKSADLPRTLKRPYIMGTDLVITEDELRKVDSESLRKSGIASELRISAINTVPLDNSSAGRFTEVIKAIGDYNSRSGSQMPRGHVSTLESKFRSEIALGKEFSELLKRIAHLAFETNLAIFLEPDLSQSNWEDILAGTTRSLAECNICVSPGIAGLKCRTSGDTAIGPARLAKAIEQANEYNLPFKVTGGLHYPLASEERPLGFLSLSAAVALSRHFGLDAEKTSEILTIRDISELSVEGRLSWRELHLSPDETYTAVSSPWFTIGCCNPSIQDEELEKLLMN